ncbi:MAG: DUF262 domain-containing protein [Treponema sp.]|nr:DUF262 domain-containing protein [Treponema sp.]
MKITLNTIKIRDLVDGYQDNDEAGVVGYGGRLDIRPPYQREFCYDDNQQQAVMDTVTNGFPLNTMYWVVRDDGRYEVLDGQQRTISICRYVNGSFSHNMRYFTNLQPDEKENILNYDLQVYFCEGSESEKLSWFKTINIAGERLTNQEIRNAVFAGSWTAEAKKIFSKSNCAGKLLSDKYVNANPIRQELLETALSWFVGKDDKLICKYMGQHQNDANANELWVYFQFVIAWVKAMFIVYRKEMKGIDWGSLYNQYHENSYDPAQLEDEICSLIENEEVTNHKGIYYYLFDRKESHLSLREFDEKMKRKAYEQQGGICPLCKKRFEFSEMEGDHIIPWSKGGKTVMENLQMLCRLCNNTKSDR